MPKQFLFRLLPLAILIGAGWLLVSCSSDTTGPGDGKTGAPDAGWLASDDKAVPITTFIVHGDTHSGDDADNPEAAAVHASFVSQFTSMDPTYIFHVGDVVDTRSTLDNPYKEDYDQVWGGLKNSIPIYPSLGNHDDPDSLYGYFFNGEESPRYVVTDPASGCLFIVLDIPACDDYTNLSVQENFLQTALTNPAHADLPHRFVFFHVSPYTLGVRNDCPPAAYWNDMMEQYGVDIVFSGHTHAYEHFRGACLDVPNVDPPIEIPQSSIHYIVTGRSGAYYQDPSTRITCDECDNCIKSIFTHNFVYVGVGAKGRISVNVRDHNGMVLDYFQIVD